MGLFIFFQSPAQTVMDTLTFRSQKDSASYAVGLEEARRLVEAMQMQEVDSIISLDYLVRGYVDYMRSKSMMSNELSASVLERYFAVLQQNRDQQAQANYGPMIMEAESFMQNNKSKEGIISTPTGLQYSVQKKGKGKTIALGDKIKLHYTGKLVSGQVIDSSVERNEPFEFELQPDGLIQGWVEGLQLMKKGSKFTFYIPYHLGYGEVGAPPTVPPFAVLIFEIEVLEIGKK